MVTAYTTLTYIQKLRTLIILSCRPHDSSYWPTTKRMYVTYPISYMVMTVLPAVYELIPYSQPLWGNKYYRLYISQFIQHTAYFCNVPISYLSHVTYLSDTFSYVSKLFLKMTTHLGHKYLYTVIWPRANKRKMVEVVSLLSMGQIRKSRSGVWLQLCYPRPV